MGFPLLGVIGAGALALGRLALGVALRGSSRAVGQGIATRTAATHAATQAAQGAARTVMQRGLAQARQKLTDLMRRCQNCRLTREMCKKLFGQFSSPPQRGVYRGGAYDELGAQRGVTERHHMPAKGTRYPEAYGPSIQMDYADHQKTLSWSRSKPASDFRAEQRRVNRNDGFMAAMAMDILSIRAQHGDKYDAAIAEAVAYATCLDQADRRAQRPGGR